jgi:CPA1 family monovalent cation:H+ antiporter
MFLVGAIGGLIPFELFSLEEIHNFVSFQISEFILIIFIPILIFESGRKLKLSELKKEAVHISFFAIGGVVVTIFLIGLLISFVFDIPFIHGILFGTILAATDPIAINAIFKRFPVPHRLKLLLEGESLFNDATGIITFNVVKGIIFAGLVVSFLDVTLALIWSLVGAILFGGAIGWITGKVLNKWNDDEHVDFTVTIGVAVIGYIIGEHILHVSGVITTLFIALIILQTHKDLVKQVRELFHKYWDYVGILANSFLFFIIGIPLFTLSENISWTPLLLIPFGIMMLVRAVVVYGGNGFLRIFKVKVPFSWQHILTFGGIRGGIAVALVLSIPPSYEFKGLFVTLIVYLIAINLFFNPVMINQLLKKQGFVKSE